MSSNHTTALRRRMLMFRLESRQLSRRDRSRCLVDCCVFRRPRSNPHERISVFKGGHVADVSLSLRVCGGRSLLTIVIVAPFDRRNLIKLVDCCVCSNAAPRDLVHPGQSSGRFGSVRSRPSCLPIPLGLEQISRLSIMIVDQQQSSSTPGRGLRRLCDSPEFERTTELTIAR